MAEEDDEAPERESSVDNYGSGKRKNEEFGLQFSLGLFIGGMIWFFARDYLPFTVQPWDSLIFLIFTSAIVFEMRGLLTNAVLIALFFMFGKISALYIVACGMVIGGYVILRGIMSYQGDFQRALKDEVLSLIPLGVFLMDIFTVLNVFNFSRDNVVLTFMEGIPLWGLLGAILWLAEAHAIKEKRADKELRMGEKIWQALAIITLLAFVLPNMYATAAELGDIDIVSVGDINVEAPREKAKGVGEKVAQLIDPIACAGPDPDNCIKQRRAERKCEPLKEDPAAQRDCLDKELGLKEKLRFVGDVDPQQREPTELSITIDKEKFPKTIALTQSMKFTLIFKNPRKQKVRGKAYCEMKDNTGAKITGNIKTIELTTEKVQEIEFNCEPPVAWPKDRLSGEVHFIVEGLETVMRLHRVYVGKKTEENRKRSEDMALEWSANALGPDDPVWLDFTIGKNVLIDDRPPVISAWVENRQKGTIEKISKAGIILWDYPKSINLVETLSCKLVKLDFEVPYVLLDISVGMLSNPSFSLPPLEKRNADLQYGLCETILGDELKKAENPITAYYASFIEYDYKVTEKFTVTVI